MTEFQISTTINPPTPNGTAMSPQHLENERMLRSFIYFLDGYVTLFVVLIGISFNTFCMLIFQRMNRGKFSLAQYYLVIFLACQTALLCNCFLIYSLPTILYGDTRIKGPYSYVILIAHAFSGPSYIAITWIVLALTVERCFALQKPFAYRAMAKASRVKRIIIGLLVAAFIFCIPRLFEYKIVTECESNPLDTSTDTVNSTTCYVTATSTELLQNRTYWNVYHIWLMLGFVTLLPSLVVLSLTLRISCFLRDIAKQRRSFGIQKSNGATGTNCSRHERESNVMLIMVVIKFALSDPLPMAESVIGAVAPEDSPAAAALLVSAANFLVVLCCSINFIMFFASGRHFRRECRRMVSFTKDEPLNSSVSNDTCSHRLSSSVMDGDVSAIRFTNVNSQASSESRFTTKRRSAQVN